MKKILKRIVKSLLYRPRGVVMKSNSWVLRPRWIHNPDRIHIGRDCFIGRFSVFHPLAKYENQICHGHIEIGHDVYIGGYAQIHCMGRLEIGDGCVLSEHVYISDIAHGLNPNNGLIMQQELESKGPVRIGRNVFLGFGSSVLPGVTLGDHCIVGTRTVVTRSFPAYSMVAGMPARLIKVFDHATQSWVEPKIQMY
ncbi:MAG: acyltransferase [Limnohabitans sp.]